MSELSLGQIKGLTVNSNVVTVPSGHTLYAPGHVIQVVSSTYTTETSMSSQSFTSTNLTATITPKFSTSKILVLVSANIQGDTAHLDIACTIFRGTVGGTNLGNGNNGLTIYYPGAYANIRMPITINTLDSPNTTSAVTYTYAVRKIGATGIVYSHAGSPASTITLMEVAA